MRDNLPEKPPVRRSIISIIVIVLLIVIVFLVARNSSEGVARWLILPVGGSSQAPS